MTIKEMIEVMQAYERGEQIEYAYKGKDSWYLSQVPSWDWVRFDYRIKPQPTYRPYNDAAEVLAAQKEHGMYVRNISYGNPIYEMPIRIYNWYILTTIIGDDDTYKFRKINYEKLSNEYIWQDGAPCGIKCL